MRFSKWYSSISPESGHGHRGRSGTKTVTTVARACCGLCDVAVSTSIRPTGSASGRHRTDGERRGRPKSPIQAPRRNGSHGVRVRRSCIAVGARPGADDVSASQSWTVIPQPGNWTDERVNFMLYTIAVVLLIMWVLGLVTSTTMGGFIHILLVVAIVMVLVNLISGRCCCDVFQWRPMRMNTREWVTVAESEQVTTDKLIADLRMLAADTEALLRATASQTGQQVAQVRARAEVSSRWRVRASPNCRTWRWREPGRRDARPTTTSMPIPGRPLRCARSPASWSASRSRAAAIGLAGLIGM